MFRVLDSKVDKPKFSTQGVVPNSAAVLKMLYLTTISDISTLGGAINTESSWNTLRSECNGVDS